MMSSDTAFWKQHSLPSIAHIMCRLLAAVYFSCALPLPAFDRPETTFKVFQFPQNQIPRVDGDSSDWNVVPDDYAITTDQLVDDNKRHPAPDPKNLEIKLRVGWVKGLNRLYFLYEAYDDYWDFSLPGLHNDTLELVVDGDASGGSLVDKGNREFWKPERFGAESMPDERIGASEFHWAMQGVHAQNYHIFTPALEKDWCMAWAAATWIKDFPYANAAYHYDFKPGQPGHLVLEFWITPFDYAGAEGPQRAVESVLRENKIVGLSFLVIDYDDPNRKGNNGFWTLSRHRTMYGNADQLCAFKLMPLEAKLLPEFEARWSFKIVDPDRREVVFKDETIGRKTATAWKWDFGDGETSTEQNPIHVFKKPDNYVTILEVTAADGAKSRRSKVWDVQLR